MTERGRARQAADAYKAEDWETLFDLALAFAKRADLADELDRRDAERRAMQTKRTRESRARNVTERDVTLRNVTGADVTRQSDTSSSSTKPKSSKDSPRRPSSPLPGVPWVSRLTGVWTSLAGAVQPGQVGKQLKPFVESRGLEAVEAGMRVYVAHRQRDGAPMNFGWFAADAVQWIDRAGQLGTDHGELNGALELASRPPKVRA